MQRINTKKELLDWAVNKYAYYSKIFLSNRDSVTVYYVKDFMNDLLLIQRFASKEDETDTGKERPEGLANMS